MDEMKKPNVLNFKYEIFPTAPQRANLNRILRESRIQWNKAVTMRKKLKTALRSGQVEYVINSCLSSGKSDMQGGRKKAIMKFRSDSPSFSNLDFDSAAKLYDIRNLAGKLVDIDVRHLDTSALAGELRSRNSSEISERNNAKKTGVDTKKLPKLPTYWALSNAIDRYAGFAAKKFMDKSFVSPSNMTLSPVRSNISGYANSEKWNTAVKPSKVQRAYGATGEPRYKRRCEGFAYQIQDTETTDLIRDRKKGGYLIQIKALPNGMRWVPVVYHRPVPEGAKIKQFTVNAKAGRYFAVLSAEVPDAVWKIAPMDAGWHAGIDPGASTALTVALKNAGSGALAHFAAHWEFLEKAQDRLEKMQQELARKQGPVRERTEEEVKEALQRFAAKASVRKLPADEREKEIAKKEKWLRSTKVRNMDGMSNRWRRWARRVSGLNFRVANQRADVHHKLSRALAEGCDLVGFGDWEPVREVSYRKKIKAAKKKLKQGMAGAAEELEALEEEKSKQGPKGAKKQRRGGRDRGIASLRRLVEEKAGRAGTLALTNIKEAGSTMTCCVCGEQTGPKGDLSTRQWRCEKCNTLHHRDLNSGYNMLRKTEQEIASAQEAVPETASDATRTTAQGATGQAGRKSGFRATGSSGRSGSFFYGNADGTLPNLWNEDVPKALKSLFQMGIARSLTLQTGAETGTRSPS